MVWGPVAGSPAEIDVAAVSLDQLAGDGQAESQAAVPARGRAVPLAERLEDVFDLRRRHAARRIGDENEHLLAGLTEARAHLAASRRVLDRVVEDVAQRHPQAGGIAARPHGPRRLRRRARTARPVIDQSQRPPRWRRARRPPAGPAASAEARDSTTGPVRSRARRPSAAPSTSASWRRALRSMTSSPRSTCCGATPRHAQQLGPAQDRVERRPQLVRDDGQELILQAAGVGATLVAWRRTRPRPGRDAGAEDHEQAERGDVGRRPSGPARSRCAA